MAFAFLQANAQVDASVQELLDKIAKCRKFEPGQWVNKVKAVGWKAPGMTGDEDIDEIFRKYQDYYNEVKEMMEDLVFYDVKLIKDTSTGDQLLAIVDKDNNIMGLGEKVSQRIYAVPVYVEKLEKKLGFLDDAVIITKDPLRQKTATKKYWRAKKEFSKFRKVVETEVTAEFKQQKEIIQLFIEWKKNRGEGKRNIFVKVPESDTIPAEIPVLEKSTEQIDAELDALGI